MNIATLALSKSYTDAKLMKDLKSVELIDDNTLQFTLGNGSKSNIDLNGLLSAEQISKLDSIDSQFLDRFSVDETSGALLFDKNPISKENITKLEDWVQHGTYTQFQLVSYMGKLYRLKFNVVDAIITPDINPANYELFSGGSGGSSSIKFAGFTPNNEYSFADPIIYNDCLMTAKSSFRSGNDIDLNDWNIISDMHKRVYDVDGNAIVDKADHANIADLALETTLVQTWKPNKDYTAGQNLVYNYETYTVTNNYTSGLIFDKTNLTLSATGNHNGLNSLQGGDSVNGEYYHINKSKHDIIDNITDLNGRLAYYDKALGDMDKSIYDVNNDGIVDKASTLDGLASTVTELNYIHGAKGNIQAQIDALSSIGNFTGSAPTYADIATLFSSPKQKDMVIVITDEKNKGASTIYLYSEASWTYAGAFTATIRDFSTNPLDVVTESTGIYLESRIDSAIARKTDVPNIPNLALLTTYDQSNADLLDAVTNKHPHPNKALLDTYTQTNTDIATAINKAHTHTNKTVIDNFSEDSSGKPLYKGNPLGSGSGGSGISDLSAFNTADLKEATNCRYVTDAEKGNIQNLSAIASTQTSMNVTLTAINGSVPTDASSTNKLVTNNTVDTKISNAKFTGLADVDHAVKPNAFLVTNSTGTQVTYKSSIKDLIKIQEVTDKDGTAFTDVPTLSFKNLVGAQDATTGKLELSLPNMFTTDLVDMPKKYENGKIPVANESLQIYELKSISELTNSKENFTKTIGQADWYHDTTLNMYTKTVTHSLKSKNLIIGICDAFDNSINNITWQILDVDTVMFKAPTDTAIRVVINCSQGVAGSGTGSTGGGITTITASDFIDDFRVRDDKTYSSTKIMNTLGNYTQKSAVYTKTESNALYASKLNEHIHANMSALGKISEDATGNMYFGDKKILTNLEPFTYQKHWDNETFSSTALLVDVNNIFNTNSYNAILDTELTIKNNIATVDETTDAKAENQLRVTVIDNGLVVLDVYINAGSTQKYLLGISPNVQIMVQGMSFSANYYLTAY